MRSQKQAVHTVGGEQQNILFGRDEEGIVKRHQMRIVDKGGTMLNPSFDLLQYN